MEQFLENRDEKKGINKVFVVALIGAAVLIGVVIVIMSFRPSLDDRMANVVADAYHEGSPEFAELRKDIVISNDNTIESPMATGKVSMFLHGKIHNKGTRTITVLEVNAAVVTQFNEVLRERRMLVIPLQQPNLGPDEVIPITLTLDGFNKSDDRANIRWKVTAIKADK
jgi:hypothetical protein